MLVSPLQLLAQRSDIITPYKWVDYKYPKYQIPPSCRFTVPRQENEPAIVYYISKPDHESYPIAIVCTGSTTQDSISSIIHFHRYFLQEFLDLGIGVLSIEQWGVDGDSIDAQEFMHHYTRSQRLKDHCAVINHLISHPPIGWNGKFIFLGVSEGGPLVTSLTAEFQAQTIATINWCGAGDWNWADELWAFIQDMRKNGPWYIKLWDFMPRWMPCAPDVPRSRQEFDARMQQTLAHPCPTQEFLGMTHLYHADALTYPMPAYEKIKTPFLVVAGSQDSIIDSCDDFVRKAQEARVPITYTRVPGMDHYIRKRPEIMVQSFDWLGNIIASK
jgi:pimeloyl-ACP methyl ester carboxylesterase